MGGLARFSLRPGLAAVTVALTVSGAPAVEPAPPGRASRVTVPVDGAAFAAVLVAVDRDWAVTFDVDQQRRRMPAADLVVWGAPSEGRRGTQVLTAEGSLLVGKKIRLVDQQLRIGATLAGPVMLPLSDVCGLVFQRPADRLQSDRLAARVRAVPRDTDRLILTNDDRVSGTVTAIDDDHVAMETPLGGVQIETDRIAALLVRFAPVQPADDQGLDVLVGWRDGTLVHARSLVVTEASVSATLQCGARLTDGKPDDLVYLQPLGGRVVYLSDLASHNYRHMPYLTLPWPLRTDRNVLGGRLRCQNRLYSKGLGMHTAARVAYRLDRPFRRFEAEVAIDDHTACKGSAQFRVLTHADGVWTEAYASPIVRGGADPLPVSVNLAGADAMSLLVDFADHGDELDHANWLSARLVK
jgi:hypothetical protein